MLAKILLQYLLAAVFGIGFDEGYATIFGTPNDPHDGDQLACTRKEIPQDQPLCAHRWLPCGTKIVVMNLERPGVASCRVADRGPFGVNRVTGRWRGVIDLTPGAARDVRLDGRDLVRIYYKLPPPSNPVYSNTSFLVPPRRGPAI